MYSASPLFKLFTFSHCKLKIVYIEKVNRSSLQSAQLKNKSNTLIQNLFNHCFEKPQTSVVSLFK